MGGFTGRTTWDGPRMNTQVSGGADLFQMMRRRQQPQPQPNRVQIGGRQSIAPPPSPGTEGHVVQTELQRAQEAAQIAQLQAITGQVPQRQLTGFNMQGNTPDVEKFTGAQRALYLPQGSGYANPMQAGLGSAQGSLDFSPGTNQPAAGGFQQGMGPGNPDERPDWFNLGTTSGVGQQQLLRQRQAQREQDERQAQEQAMRQRQGNQMLLYGSQGQYGSGRR